MEFHREIFNGMKRSQFITQVQRDLQTIIDDLNENPARSIARYERIISKDYISSCNSARDIYFFMLFKLSLSKSAGDKNVLEYQEKKLRDIYENRRMPTFLRQEYPFHTLFTTIGKNEERNELLAKVLEYDGHLFETLRENVNIYDSLENIAKRDEELEGKLMDTMVQYFARDFANHLVNEKVNLCSLSCE
jgi:hypothetical protein